MRRTQSFTVLVVVLVLGFGRLALAQSGNWKKALEEALEQDVYQKSKVATFEINNVTSPGTVFVVQKEGIVADRAHSFGTFVTKIKEGQPEAPGGAGGFFSRSSSRILKKGERVYLYDVEMKDDAILLNLLTCDMYDVAQKGSTEHTRLKSSVRFEFSKEELPKMDAKALKAIFDSVLLPEADAAAANTKTISLGQTAAEVEAILGKPDKIVNLGEKVTYVYKDMKVVFINGKVADVQ